MFLRILLQQHRPVDLERPNIAASCPIDRQLAQNFAKQPGELKAVRRSQRQQHIRLLGQRVGLALIQGFIRTLS